MMMHTTTDVETTIDEMQLVTEAVERIASDLKDMIGTVDNGNKRAEHFFKQIEALTAMQ